MSKFYKLKVIDVVRETADSVSVAFQIPDEFKNIFKYTQGQYITLKLNLKGEEIRRSYSICSSLVEDRELRIAIKMVRNGRGGSIYLNENIKVGDSMEMMPPMGNFYTDLNSSNRKKYILFAGGSGITPMLSILKTTLFVEPQSNIVLFYGNLNESAIIFKKQLENLVEKYSQRLKIYHILDQPCIGHDDTFNGIMSVDKTKMLMGKFVNLASSNEYFICGPGGMMTNVVAALQDLKIDKSKVHVEYFVAPVDTSQIVEQRNTPDNLTFTSKVTIICDGDRTELELGADDTILEAALGANIDAPYACQGGSCCTCRAKLIEGKVEMKVNYALLDSEVDQGYILTCQSRPLTPTVIVDYDKGR